MNLAFYAVCVVDDDAYRGAMLVVDELGIPLEFKVTGVFKITQMHTALYGSILDRYISLDLCGVPLYESLENDPDILFVNQDNCILLSNLVDSTVICIKPNNRVIPNNDNEFDFIYDSDLKLEIGYSSDMSHKEINKNIFMMKDANNSFKLIDVFDRINNAINIVNDDELL